MFTKAEKSKSKLRCAIFGAAGCGKTYSSLAIAKGIGGKVAVIDTENGSSNKYADRFNDFAFDVCTLTDQTIDSYIKAIDYAEQQEYSVLIIDSLTHGWQELLQEINKIAKTKFSGNTWSAWSEGTPVQKRLINTIVSFNGHMIVTMRCKTEWALETNEKGKAYPVRMALAPEQGKGIEYEFDLLLSLSNNHAAEVIKDRTGKFQDKIIEKPGVEFGKELIAWLSDGKDFTEIAANLIENCEDLDQLKIVFSQQYKKLTDEKDREYLIEIKDHKKESLTKLKSEEENKNV
jgi:hypothetical protein